VSAIISTVHSVTRLIWYFQNNLKRSGECSAYKYAPLAVKFDSEILLDDLLVRLSADCPWRDHP
jgi:hypothetical protein